MAKSVECSEKVPNQLTFFDAGSSVPIVMVMVIPLAKLPKGIDIDAPSFKMRGSRHYSLPLNVQAAPANKEFRPNGVNERIAALS